MDKEVTFAAKSDFAGAEAIRIAEFDGLVKGVWMGAGPMSSVIFVWNVHINCLIQRRI